MARHAAPSKRRGGWIATVAVVVVAAVVAAILIGTSGGGTTPTAAPRPSGQPTASPAVTPTPSCPQRRTLRVVAASGIAPVVRSVAAGTCVDVSVTVDDTVQAAAALKRDADVWIPDSRARAVLASTAQAATAPSVAVSPIVIAADDSLDPARLPATRALSWSAVLQPATLAPLKLEVQDPKSSSTSLVLAAALGPLAESAGGDRYSALAQTAVASAALTSGAPTAGIGAAALRIEEARLATRPGTKILDMAGGYPQLDYPWVASTGASSSTQAAAKTVLDVLRSDTGDAARARQGLLNPGAAAVEPGSYPGARTGPLAPVPGLDEIPTLYAVADAGAQHGNLLAVLDVSGSMAEPAGTGAGTKLQAVQDSAKLAMQLLAGDSRVGLWEFGSLLAPPDDHRELLPISALSTSRNALIDALDAAQVRPTSGTSLYRTVLDGYVSLQARWQPGYVNSLLVFTDGKDEDDPAGIPLATLQRELERRADPARPIQVIMLGYGQADIPAMTAIAKTVDGVVYPIDSPTQLVGAFIDAISRSVLNSLRPA